MKILACLIKSFKENIRDWKILILVILFAPIFVYLMYFYFNNPGSTIYRALILNNDGGVF